MRRLASAAVLLAVVLALAGCGGEDAPALWEERPELQPDGDIPVEEFASFQDEVDARWERSPVLLAGEFLRLDESDAFRTSVDADAGPEATGPATVTVTLDGLQDDSVAAERYVLELSRSDDAWALESATWAQRCQAGRGHQAFTPEPCV